MSSGRDDGRGGNAAACRTCFCFSCRQRREAFGNAAEAATGGGAAA